MFCCRGSFNSISYRVETQASGSRSMTRLPPGTGGRYVTVIFSPGFLELLVSSARNFFDPFSIAYFFKLLQIYMANEWNETGIDRIDPKFDKHMSGRQAVTARNFFQHLRHSFAEVFSAVSETLQLAVFISVRRAASEFVNLAARTSRKLKNSGISFQDFQGISNLLHRFLLDFWLLLMLKNFQFSHFSLFSSNY